MTSSNDNKPGMTSSVPYLIRAIYEWIVDNDLTPYLMVDANRPGIVVPQDYLDEHGRIILNISPGATSELLMSNEEITFNARFSGQSMGVVVPTHSVRAIYARENGQGMMFDESKDATDTTPANNKGNKSKKRVALEAVSTGNSASAKSNDAEKSDGQKSKNQKSDASSGTKAKQSGKGKVPAEDTGEVKGPGNDSGEDAGKGSDKNNGKGSDKGNGKGKKGPHLTVIK